MNELSVEERALGEFLDASDRNNFLAMRSDAMRRALYATWARSDRLRLDDVVALKSPWRHEATMHLIGNEKLAIRDCGRSFVVAPTVPGSVVLSEDGTSQSMRQWRRIDKPTTLETRKALNALLQFGAHAENEEQRGKLKEMSVEELADWTIAQRAEPGKKKG